MNERARGAVPRQLARIVLLLAAAMTAGQAGAEAPLPAEAARLADHSLLIAMARAGKRLVAVGDRGVIVYSADQGENWTQAATVPVQSLLTGVCFFDSQHGIAVGHDQTVLTTADGGRTWALSHRDVQAQGPLLDVWCGTGGRALAVGAYSVQLVSEDAGAHWSERRFSPTPLALPAHAKPAAAPAGHDDGGAANGYHLNRIVAASASRLYVAGEAGHLYRSDDSGVSWLELPSPYEGSFFGVLPLSGDVVLAFGLRGSLYRSDDAGASWHKIETGTTAMLDNGVRLGEAGAAIVGLAGVVLVSSDGGRSFALEQQADHVDLSAALAVGDQTLATAGVRGVRVIRLEHAQPDGEEP